MNMQHLSHKKKTVIISGIIITILIAGTVGYRWCHHRFPSHYVAQRCSEYGPAFDYFDGPDSFKEMTSYSATIVVATVEYPGVLEKSLFPDDPKPLIKVAKVLKGNVHTNDILPICSGMGYIDLPAGNHPTVVVFLENKDGDTWIPTKGSFGILPKDKDGRFKMDGISDGPKSVSLSELEKITKQ